MFERFRQADASTSRAHSGLGIGLAIARHLVELHGGRLSVASEGRDKGATFTVTLPVRRAGAVVEEGGAASERSAAREGGIAPLAGLRILVVDDEADARDLVPTPLSACGGEVRAVAR